MFVGRSGLVTPDETIQCAEAGRDTSSDRECSGYLDDSVKTRLCRSTSSVTTIGYRLTKAETKNYITTPSLRVFPDKIQRLQ